MNYGYAPVEPTAPLVVLDAADEADRYCIQLYAHTLDGVGVAGADVLEVGSGRGGGASWVSRSLGPRTTTGVDFAGSAVALSRRDRAGPGLQFVQGDAQALPFADGAFDIACTAFGAIPFVADSGAVMREVARVLRPGGSWVFSITHPMRWIFLDEPGPEGLLAVNSYFDRRPYVEQDGEGVPGYVEQHRTLGDRVRELVGAGFVLRDLVEPEWPAGHEGIWGQWSPLRGRLFPGTAIFVADRPGP